jgi:hypothetical protein
MAATMRSLTSPVMAPLYWPTQARSDWIASRSASAIALAVSAGVCNAGRAATAAASLGLGPAEAGAVAGCAPAEAPATAHINVADSIDLMRSLGIIDPLRINHIWLIGDSDAMVQSGAAGRPQCVVTMMDRKGLTAPC